MDLVIRKARVLLGLALAIASMPALAPGQKPLTSLRAIHALSNAQASHQLPVSFEATVIYYRGYERTLFVQDGDLGIYVQPRVPIQLAPGDRIIIEGTTHESFRPFIAGANVTVLRHGALPRPVPATYDSLIRAMFDCRLVTVRAVVRSVDLVLSSDVPSISMQMRTEGGAIDAVVDSADIPAVKQMLDAEVELTGAVSGHFDGKMQVTGILLHANSLAAIKVIKPAFKDPWDLPLTRMDEVLAAYHVNNTSERVRVHGTVTYYQPGSVVVLQSGSRSIWVMTHSSEPLQVGHQADAIGFPGLHDGFLTLMGGEIEDTKVASPVQPRSVTWSELATSHYLFDLVSTEGVVVAENRGAAQDEYVLDSGGSLFSAIYRHPAKLSTRITPLPAMKKIPVGSRVRVTGICLMGASNPFDTQVPFDVLMRSSDDIIAVAAPSWFNVGNLTRIIGVLLIIVLLIGAWGWTLLAKLKRQTAAITANSETVAKQERHNAQLEAKRSRILEDINSSRPLPELIEAITEMVAFSLDCPFAWCEMLDGGSLGNAPASSSGFRIGHLDIPARAGGSLGTLYAATESGEPIHPDESAMLEAGVRLATLAIETRKLYKDLVYRSEFDLLTDIYNRFSLDRYLEEQIEKARTENSIFGLVYIDLDEFKQVNDFYGHHVGDLYLHEVSMRMKRQLRTGDMLARLGGDEFAALVPVVRSRAALEEVAQRLERCFDAPFAVEGYILRGGASVGIALYPEDGTSADSLLSAADAAMYVNKHTKRHKTEMPGQLQQALFKPRR
ncbi:GGDEF domain-containing protein [Occallatibacter savannae]|uniref:GGDEF domain-containing protein n=1 Tax=Occallatibacter savannae TaxID=1002691 RepID=UPI000D68BF13|nr:GGDEF domain-containing protein [Occallatibacter savannae]